MGKIITPKYRVEYRDNLLAMCLTLADKRGVDGRPCKTQCWDGRATSARLEDWRRAMNRSFQPGGANEHIAEAFNAVPHIFAATIVRQSDDKAVCSVMAPAFEVVEAPVTVAREVVRVNQIAV